MTDRLGGVSFAVGAPDLTLLAAERLRLAIDDVLGRLGTEAAGNVPIQGIQDLREVIADRLRPRGIAADADSVVVLHGATQGLDLLLYHLGRRDARVGRGPRGWLDAGGVTVVKETGAVTGYLGGMTLAAAVGRPASCPPARRILMSTATRYA